MFSLFKKKKDDSQQNTTNQEPNNQEGQLVVDVYQTENEIVVRTPVAGVKLADIHITISDNQLTIKGQRTHDDVIPEGEYLLRECFWGGFARTLVLPFNLDPERIQAFFKDGILKIVIPHEKVQEKTVKITEVTAQQ
ncbi:MAG: Hsp20/alpha crystallin family protein [Candidatus Abawacabacteria bacterium]|nr:Hsp20/alpha crystallin family protein [Candidatus Abawacabacteria bacterium]